jgi:hypothetical protein
MKTKNFTHFLLSLLLIGLFFSCTKSIDNIQPLPQTSQLKQTDQTLSSKYLVRELAGTTLAITMDPVVTCYGYRNGEQPKPCDITIEITCTLSNPIDKGISIEVQKITDVDIKKDKGNAGAASQATAVMLNIAPHTTKVTLKTNLSNPDNQDIADLFRLGNVMLYTVNN